MSIVLENITKQWPGTRALDGVSLEVVEGRVHGIVGENGAGKTTLVSILSGAVKPTTGALRMADQAIVFENPAAAVAHGVSLVSQEGSLVPHLSAAENICLGSEPVRGRFLINRREVQRQARALAEKWFPDTEIKLERKVADLPYADQKIVEILRALHSKPKVLILDEPTATLPAKEKESLWILIRQLSRSGIAVILISHFLKEVIDLCDEITVLQDGRKVSHLNNLQHDVSERQLVDLMLNRERFASRDPYFVAEASKERRPLGASEVVINVRNWSGDRFSVAELSVQAGEILGLIGLTGSGHFEFAQSLFEPRLAHGGSYFFQGRDVGRADVRDMKRHGAALVPDHRMINAMIGDWTVRENMSMAGVQETCVKPFGLIQGGRERSETLRLIKRLNIKTASAETKIIELSGGNKQKVSVAKWQFAAEGKYKLFIFVEPTEGVDIGAKREIHDLIVSLAEQGAAVVLASSDLLEIAHVADRVVAFRGGREADQISRKDFSETVFINAIAGATR
ncbi:sugar ABC transporter ATP-binding protein [Methylovirgula sp. 4M-Z18]|uniref:sugar ABC transporter ATP-binding protein n=1 Tax=Methylovirgula sp. 4M-Z18 TaxID=2293567 RepID=UPI000E2F6D71|nr:sugar ABC transporter ATP-binding protein [Methylovirgula sp. 4M-Z18]RFB74952.1 sugar ABC transporter ATP-binding protein [Methylovirgula sp. 4M-Z18]